MNAWRRLCAACVSSGDPETTTILSVVPGLGSCTTTFAPEIWKEAPEERNDQFDNQQILMNWVFQKERTGIPSDMRVHQYECIYEELNDDEQTS